MEQSVYEKLLDGSFVTHDNPTGISDRERNTVNVLVNVVDATSKQLYKHGHKNKVCETSQALMSDSFEEFWNEEYRERLLREGIRQIVDVTIKDYEPRFPEIEINRCIDGINTIDDLIIKYPLNKE